MLPTNMATNMTDMGTLTEISDYPWRWRRDYLMLVAAVAVSDEELHPDEMELLKRWVEQFRLPPKSREAVFAVLKNKPLDRPRIERRLSRTDLVYSLMLDLMGMAMADGILMDKEIHFLRGIAENLEIDPIDFNILIEFIHSAHQAAQMDNPEPLYEHNIESAFQLMLKRNVRLFPHTLLCVSSPEYDLQLKERWMRFVARNNNR
ncbi:MAG: TerB family tellurite resistance protein [SAR324 cluster bacterium]|nr:TerB family tellurite resistance protein [SAR324 cluster bacterium]